MAILVPWEGKVYEWDGDLDVAESAVINAATGIPGLALMDILNDPHNEKFVLALQSLLWVFKSRAGEKCDLLNLNFRIGAFMEALSNAQSTTAAGDSETPKAPAKRKVVAQTPG